MTTVTPVWQRMSTKLRKAGRCWIYTGSLSWNGYPIISMPGRPGHVARGHRVAYELFKGPIPAGLHIDHLCGIRACVNPDHLEAVDQATNNRRAAERRRIRKAFELEQLAAALEEEVAA